MPSSGWWFSTGASGIIIPAGIIMPYNDADTSIPNGWVKYNNGGSWTTNKLIRGSATTVGSGGSNNLSVASNSAGSHVGTNTIPMFVRATAGTNTNFNETNSNPQGGGAHTVTLSYIPPRRELLLVKALVDTKKVPKNVGIMADFLLSDLSDISPTGESLSFQSGSSPVSQSQYLAGVSVNTIGFHHHAVAAHAATATGTTQNTNYWHASGSHNHGISSISATDNLSRFWLGLWTDASKDFTAQEGIIGMWENSTPPTGWVICDGTNGTPNLVDKFIGFDVSQIGTATGNGTVSASGSLASGGGHAHTGATVWHPGVNRPHNTQGAHSHTFSGSPSMTPEHYTLIFIKHVG